MPIYFAIGLLATTAYFVRAWGIALVAALVLWYTFRRNWRGLFCVIAPFSLGYVFWSARNNALGGAGASYGLSSATVIPFLQELAHDLPSKAVAQWVQNLPDFLIPLLFGPKVLEVLGKIGLAPLSFIAGGIVLAILITGYLAQARSKASVAEYYVPIYLVILTLGPQDSRYWVPLTPLLILYLTVGVKIIASWIANRLRIPRLAPAFIGFGLFALISLHLARDVQAVINPVRNRIPDVAVGPSWLATNVPIDAVVMAPVPRVTYIYSQRTTVPYPDGGDGQRYKLSPELYSLTETTSLQRFYESLDLFNVDYLLIEPDLVSGTPFSWQDYFRTEIIPALEQEPERFQLVYMDESELVRVYQVYD